GDALPWWSSRLVSMLRLFQRDGPFIRANASFARSRLDFRTAILSFRMSSRSVTPCSTMASRRLCGPSAAAHRDPLIGHDHMVERDFPHTFATGRILRRLILGGLHHQYVRI